MITIKRTVLKTITSSLHLEQHKTDTDFPNKKPLQKITD